MTNRKPIIRKGPLNWTEDEIRETGRRHGMFGTVFHPPGSWGVIGNFLRANAIYEEAYVAGKAHREFYDRGVRR